MTAPKLAVKVEPSESGKVVYSKLAPKSSGSAPHGQIALLLSILNKETAKVHLSQLKVSFIGNPPIPDVSIPLGLDIDPNKTLDWFFSTAQNIIIPVPAPQTIKLDLSCDNFSSPFTLTMPLAAHKSPTAVGSYYFPAHASEDTVRLPMVANYLLMIWV